MDLEMPVMNGFEATARLRARDQSTGQGPCMIIGLSSHDDEGTRRRSLEAGCDLYLTKPVTKEELRRALLGLTDAASAVRLPSDAPGGADETDAPGPARPEDAVYVDEDLREGLPSFLQSRREAVDSMMESCAAGDAAGVRQLAHRLSGSFALYGFRWAAGHCRLIEHEADSLSRDKIEERLALLRHHLGNVPVRFVDLAAGAITRDGNDELTV
jgi:CheY-like chemotaxis protein